MSKPTPITDEAFPASKGKPDGFEVTLAVGRLREAERARNLAIEALKNGIAATDLTKPTTRALLRSNAVMRQALARLMEGGAA